MPIDSQGALFAALGNGEFEELLGTEENEWLDFKLTGYQLDQVRQRWELAKDVAAFANTLGGCLVLGVKTEREAEQITDVAVVIRRIAKSTIDAQRYLDVLADWCYPHLQGIKLHWFPKEGSDGIFVIEVPAQPPRNRFILVTHAVDENDRQLNAVMIPVRECSRVVTLPPGEVHRLISDGLRMAATPLPEETGQAPPPDGIIEQLERAQQWEELPTLFLQAIPSDSERLKGFYDRDGIRGALARNRPVREHAAGFNLRIFGDMEVDEGALVYTGDSRRSIRIDPSGLFTVGVLATPDYLAWGTASSTSPGTSQIWLNSIALIEMTLEFYRFFEHVLTPAASPPTAWSTRILCRRFDIGPVCLREGPPTMTGIPSMTPQAASANNWVRQVSVSGDPEADAYAALVEIYSLFGLPESAIPYAEGASVSIEKLRVV